MSPTPRTSFALAVHRKRAVLFGGVHDREGAGDKLYSELFNELYQFNLDSRRWFPLALRPAPKPKADADAAAAAAAEAPLPLGVSPEMHAALAAAMADTGSALHRAAARIQAQYRGYVVRKVGAGEYPSSLRSAPVLPQHARARSQSPLSLLSPSPPGLHRLPPGRPGL